MERMDQKNATRVSLKNELRLNVFSFIQHEIICIYLLFAIKCHKTALVDCTFVQPDKAFAAARLKH